MLSHVKPFISTFCFIKIFLLGFSQIYADDSNNIKDIFVRLRDRSFIKSYDVLITHYEASQKRAALYSAWTHWAPRVELELERSQSKDYSLVNSGSLGSLGSSISVSSRSQSKWSLMATMPLYRRSVHLGVQQAGYENQIAKVTDEIKLDEQEWKLRKYFGHYLLQKYKLATIQNSIEIAKTNLREAELRFELGQKTKIDLLRARANLLSLESQKNQFVDLKNDAFHDLIELSGLSQPDLVTVGVDNLAPLPTEEQLNFELENFAQYQSQFDAMSDFIGDSSETVPHQLQEQAVRSPLYLNFLSQESLGMSRARNIMAEVWPELSLRGTLSKQGDNWTKAFESGSRSSFVALVLNIPLFNFGSTFSTMVEKSALQEMTGAKSTRDMIQFINQIESERSKILSLRKSLDANKIKTSQNEEIYRLSIKSYQLGKTTMVELLSAQNDFIQSKIEVAQIKLDLSIGLRQLAWQIGKRIAND